MKPILGIVGSIGSGKSLVAAQLAGRGGWLIDGDALGHQALRQPEIKNQVIARFGPGVVDPQGEISRRALAAKVFVDAGQRRALEAIVFPFIKEGIAREIERGQRDAGARFIVLDAAVMLEAGWSGACDKLIFVDAPRELRLARLKQRGWDERQLASREAAQMPLEEKKRRADAVIDNGGTREEAARKVDALLAQWSIA
jgi:dephospho-CoA kinase